MAMINNHNHSNRKVIMIIIAITTAIAIAMAKAVVIVKILVKIKGPENPTCLCLNSQNWRSRTFYNCVSWSRPKGPVSRDTTAHSSIQNNLGATQLHIQLSIQGGVHTQPVLYALPYGCISVLADSSNTTVPQVQFHLSCLQRWAWSSPRARSGTCMYQELGACRLASCS